MPALCCRCGAALPLSQRRFPRPHGDWGSVCCHTEQMGCPSSSSPRKEADYLSLLSTLEKRRWSSMTHPTHTGSLCLCPHDQRALLSLQGHLPHRETWNEVTVLPLPASPPPQVGVDANGVEAEPQPLLPTTAPCSPLPTVAFPSKPEQNIQLCSSPLAPSSRGKAGQLGQEHPPAAGRPRCSPVPHKFVRSLGMEFMRGDSSKEKVPEITA